MFYSYFYYCKDLNISPIFNRPLASIKGSLAKKKLQNILTNHRSRSFELAAYGLSEGPTVGLKVKFVIRPSRREASTRGFVTVSVVVCHHSLNQ